MTPAELNQRLEAQEVRVFDMFALGPFMLWYAVKSGGKGGMRPWPRRVLFVSGVMTIIYNWKNYRNIAPIIAEKYAKMEETSARISGIIENKNFLSKG